MQQSKETVSIAPEKPTSKFVYEHQILLNETNAMGGVVYFAHFAKWQGMVREWILCQHPKFKEIVERPIEMITRNCSVEYLGHLYFGDVVQIEAATYDVRPTSFMMEFRYYRKDPTALVATGLQKVTFADRKTGQICRIPPEILEIAKTAEKTTA